MPSRMDELAKAKIEPALPPVTADHLLRYLMDAGLVEGGGMGLVPLTWPTLAMWSELTGVRLAPWEYQLLRRLSADYVGEMHRAEKHDAPPPWDDGMTRHALVDRALDALFDPIEGG